MGYCISKNLIKDNSNITSINSENLIKDNSNDKYYNCIEGNLYINNSLYKNVLVYFYEDYLYIKNHNLDEKISYYIITSWAYNEKKNIFIFYKKKDKEIETYNININNI